MIKPFVVDWVMRLELFDVDVDVDEEFAFN